MRINIAMWYFGIMVWTLVVGGGLIWLSGRAKMKFLKKYRRIQPRVEIYKGKHKISEKNLLTRRVKV